MTRSDQVLPTENLSTSSRACVPSSAAVANDGDGYCQSPSLLACANNADSSPFLCDDCDSDYDANEARIGNRQHVVVPLKSGTAAEHSAPESAKTTAEASISSSPRRPSNPNAAPSETRSVTESPTAAHSCEMKNNHHMAKEDEHKDDKAKRNQSTDDYKKCVAFGTLHVYEFPCCIGDHPSVKGGPPIRLNYAGMQPGSYDALPIHSYSVKVADYECQKIVSRSGLELRIPPTMRREWILSGTAAVDMDTARQKVVERHMDTAAREAQRVRQQRRRSAALVDVEDYILWQQSAVRKLQRWWNRPSLRNQQKQHQPCAATLWIRRHKEQTKQQKQQQRRRRRRRRRQQREEGQTAELVPSIESLTL